MGGKVLATNHHVIVCLGPQECTVKSSTLGGSTKRATITLLHTILTESWPFSIPFTEKHTPFTTIYSVDTLTMNAMALFSLYLYFFFTNFNINFFRN